MNENGDVRLPYWILSTIESLTYNLAIKKGIDIPVRYLEDLKCKVWKIISKMSKDFLKFNYFLNQREINNAYAYALFVVGFSIDEIRIFRQKDLKNENPS